jgi:hypothetical protein
MGATPTPSVPTFKAELQAPADGRRSALRPSLRALLQHRRFPLLTDFPTLVSGDWLVTFAPRVYFLPGPTALQPGVRIIKLANTPKKPPATLPKPVQILEC